MPVVAITEGEPPDEPTSSVEATANIENNSLEKVPKTMVHSSVMELVCPLVDESPTSSENERPGANIKVTKKKKEGKKRIIIEETILEDMSDDDLIKISQKRKSTD